jgi:hypothetical protein
VLSYDVLGQFCSCANCKRLLIPVVIRFSLEEKIEMAMMCKLRITALNSKMPKRPGKVKHRKSE